MPFYFVEIAGLLGIVSVGFLVKLDVINVHWYMFERDGGGEKMVRCQSLIKLLELGGVVSHAINEGGVRNRFGI